MEWYHYFSAFLAGVFIANAVPHFVSGISGNKFPTPFAKPHGKGPSSPTINVIWALFNLLVGYLLFMFARVSTQDNLSLILFFLGVACMSIFSSKIFAGKEKM